MGNLGDQQPGLPNKSCAYKSLDKLGVRPNLQLIASPIQSHQLSMYQSVILKSPCLVSQLSIALLTEIDGSTQVAQNRRPLLDGCLSLLDEPYKLETLKTLWICPENHRVHFDESKDLVGKDNKIIIQKKSSKLEVHLGFLQLNHQYKIAFSIPRSLCETSSESQVTSNDTTSQSPHLKIVDVYELKDELSFHVELFAHKEQLMIEEMTFRLSDVNEQISVLLNARVLGKGKGTPLLKNGIHIIHGPVEEDSDASSDFPENN